MRLNFTGKYKWADVCRYGIYLRTFLSKNNNTKWEKYKCSKSVPDNITSKKHFLPQPQKNNLLGLTIRYYSSTENDDKSPSNKLPELMNFPKIVWPSMFKSIKSFFLTTFIIKPYLDSEFNLPDFVQGSRKAVEVVSNLISQGNIKSLTGLVTSDILPNLQKSISLMSLSQRELIAINANDIYFSFPYQIGIIFNEEDKDQKRFVEITMVYHTLKGLEAMRARGEEPPLNMGLLPEYQNKISICNYRFIREFTKGVESDWTVNLLNHFRPIDVAENN